MLEKHRIKFYHINVGLFAASPLPRISVLMKLYTWDVHKEHTFNSSLVDFNSQKTRDNSWFVVNVNVF